VPGDWIYFKNKTKRWEGPVKVTTRDGKLLYCVRAGSLLTINVDHAVLVKSPDVVTEEKMPETQVDTQLLRPGSGPGEKQQAASDTLEQGVQAGQEPEEEQEQQQAAPETLDQGFRVGQEQEGED
jgi:hypothetical protein